MEKRATAKVVSRWEPLPENASTLQVMMIPEVDEQRFPLEDLSNEELMKFSKYIEQSNRTLEIESMVIEMHLNRMDPNALARMNQILEATAVALKKIERLTQIRGRASTISISRDTSGSKSTLCSSSDSQRTDTTKSGSARIGFFSFSNRKQRLHPMQRIEIINREIEELKSVLENFRKKAKKFNYVLKCRNEEMSARLAEIVQAQFTFDHKLLEEDLDPITGTLPGEKFLRYLEKSLVGEEVKVNRLKIKIGCMKNQLKALKAKLLLKKEIGEDFNEVNFELLKVKNQECQKILDEKVFYLIHLKKINKKFENMLGTNKEKLEEQMATLVQLQKTILLKNEMIEKLTEDEKEMDSEVIAATNSLEKIKKMMKSYTVPDVMDYIHTKAELHKLKKAIKVKKRQIKLKRLILSNQAKNYWRKSDDLSRTMNISVTSVNSRKMYKNF